MIEEPQKLTYTRPWLPEYQRAIIDAQERYTFTEATTKAGKTVSHIIWQYEQALQSKEGHNHWWIAPVFKQSEIAYGRLKLQLVKTGQFKFNDTDLLITYPNGARHYFKSGEKPDNLYGEDVYSCVMDEFTRMREEAWYAVRSTLTYTKGKCKFIGNVKGIMNWGYKLARMAELGTLPDSKYFKITADDAVAAGILDQKEIEDAKATLPLGIFLELYYGIPFENSSNKFCFSFSESKHTGRCEYDPKYPLYLSFDFNKNPICCAVIQNYEGVIYVLRQIKLPNSNIYNLCREIRNIYETNGEPLYIVCGDASGKAGSALVQDDSNYFVIIKKELSLSEGQMKQLPSNPKLEENQVLVNAILEHYPVVIDTQHAQGLIFDCKFVEMSPEGKIVKEDRNDPAQQADSLDCFRYYLNRFHRTFVKVAGQPLPSLPEPVLPYWRIH